MKTLAVLCNEYEVLQEFAKASKVAGNSAVTAYWEARVNAVSRAIILYLEKRKSEIRTCPECETEYPHGDTFCVSCKGEAYV